MPISDNKLSLEVVLTRTKNLCFRAEIRKKCMRLQTPVFTIQVERVLFIQSC